MKSTICVEKEVLSTHNNMVRSENGKSKHGKMSKVIMLLSSSFWSIFLIGKQEMH